MFSGSMPALVTPFDEAGDFVESAFRDLVEWQIAEGSSALVPCGTTGEAATMPAEEHFRVVRVCVDQAKGRVPVIAGAGSNDTRVAVANIKAAKEAGADAALMVPPYYNRPNQEGIFRHFQAIATACDLPIVLYNVPGRTVTDIAVETIGRLAHAFPSIVAIKDATGAIARVSAQRAAAGEEFCQLSGNDDMALAFNAMGGRGCVSVTANVAPRLCADFQAACLGGDYARALALQDKLYPLHAALFSDASPGPVKYAMTRVRRGFPEGLRLPMTWPGETSRRAVDAALGHAELA
jgi:4-hydroxy-tetrahydrodipicolinate synthase